MNICQVQFETIKETPKNVPITQSCRQSRPITVPTSRRQRGLDLLLPAIIFSEQCRHIYTLAPCHCTLSSRVDVAPGVRPSHTVYPLHAAILVLEDMDISKIRSLVQIEEMAIPPRTDRPSGTNQGRSERWDDRWNGRKNFKKFKRRGQERGPQSQKVIVPLSAL